jgi:hypothetical protein
MAKVVASSRGHVQVRISGTAPASLMDLDIGNERRIPRKQNRLLATLSGGAMPRVCPFLFFESDGGRGTEKGQGTESRPCLDESIPVNRRTAVAEGGQKKAVSDQTPKRPFCIWVFKPGKEGAGGWL